MNKKRWTIVGVFVAVVVVLGGTGCQGIAARGTATEAPETAVVQRGTLRVAVNATGNLAPSTEVSLAFSAGGRVAEVFVAEGKQVEAGQPLVRLETDDLALQVAQAEIALRQAEIQLEDLQASPDEAEVEQARAAVGDAGAAYQEAQMNQTVTEHSVSVGDEVRTARYNRDETYRRYQALVGRLGEDDPKVAGAHDAYLNALGAYNRAVENADLQLASAKNAVTQAYHTLQQAQDDLETLLAGASEREIENARLGVDQARSSLEQAQLRLEQATLTAPIDGTVTALNVQPGEMASAGQTAVVLSDVAVLEVEVNLDETDVAQVAIGQETLVSVEAFPGANLAGEVTYIAPVAQIESGVVLYPVTVRLAPTDIPVRAGMTGDVEITSAIQEGALIVPLRAVHTEGERFYVDRLAGGQTERVEVTLGMITDTEVEITSGLAEGDVVSVVAAPTQGSTQRGFGPGGMFGGGD